MFPHHHYLHINAQFHTLVTSGNGCANVNFQCGCRCDVPYDVLVMAGNARVVVAVVDVDVVVDVVAAVFRVVLVLFAALFLLYLLL